MKNAYLYIRVSTEEQAHEGFSIDNQKRACMEYAQMHTYHIKRTFQEDGKSARTTDRPAFQELLKELEEHPVDAIIIYKIDRFARNVSDFAKLYSEFKQKGIKLLSVCEGDLSEGTSLVPNIFASVAQWESEVNSQRTRDALMQKFREGWQPTPPPVGYRSVGGDRERKTCEPDPYTAPIIKELFQLYATGSYSIIEVQDWLADKNILSRNGTGLGHSVICNILNNPFYYGLIRWHGESKMGNHRPIITQELYDTCQYVLAKHRSFLIRHRVHDFLLRGFAYCGYCGQRYTAEWHYNPVKLASLGGKIAYYHCQKRDRNDCPAKYVEKEDLEVQVEDYFKTMQFSPEFIQTIVKKTRSVLEKSRKTSSSRIQAIYNQKTALETKRNKLEDTLLDGTIDRETFKRLHADIESKIMNLDTQVQDVEAKHRIDIDLIEEVLAFTRNIYETYKNAPPFLKRHYLRFFFEKINLKNQMIYATDPTPFFAVLRANQQVIITDLQLPRVDSNHEPRSYKCSRFSSGLGLSHNHCFRFRLQAYSL
ncbi:MAG: recombinase family protein [Candidatus Daviesbacteria bacterium]|nr:recombinase family protein [Candidatus Daviesbacteria bacterium]